jgi:hypothetical protein
MSFMLFRTNVPQKLRDNPGLPQRPYPANASRKATKGLDVWCSSLGYGRHSSGAWTIESSDRCGSGPRTIHSPDAEKQRLVDYETGLSQVRSNQWPAWRDQSKRDTREAEATEDETSGTACRLAITECRSGELEVAYNAS